MNNEFANEIGGENIRQCGARSNCEGILIEANKIKSPSICL